jgi:hypothetical protein
MEPYRIARFGLPASVRMAAFWAHNFASPASPLCLGSPTPPPFARLAPLRAHGQKLRDFADIAISRQSDANSRTAVQYDHHIEVSASPGRRDQSKQVAVVLVPSIASTLHGQPARPARLFYMCHRAYRH